MSFPESEGCCGGHGGTGITEHASWMNGGVVLWRCRIETRTPLLEPTSSSVEGGSTLRRPSLLEVLVNKPPRRHLGPCSRLCLIPIFERYSMYSECMPCAATGAGTSYRL